MVESPSFFSRFAEAARLHPAWVFWLCVVAHAVLWTIVPTLTDPNVLTDTIEGYAWGHEWPLGSYKHPPLAAWVLEVFALVTGRAPWAHFLASQISVAVAFWAVWQTGRRIMDDTRALIGALLLVGVGYYNILIPEFNPNVLQLPFWALIGWSFYRAVKDNRLTDWLLLGLWSAGGLYTKYSTGLLLVALGMLMVMHPETQRRFKSVGPWLAFMVMGALLIPHMIWLFQNHFMPFTYAEDRFEHVASGNAFVALMVWQIAALLPALLIYSIAFGRKRGVPEKMPASFDRWFLNTITFGPFLLASFVAIIYSVKIRNMWGAPFWNFAGLWIAFRYRPLLSNATLRRFAMMWSLIFVAGITGYAAFDFGAPYATHKAARIYFPGNILAAQISDAWQQRYHKPLRYVIGDTWVGGNVAYYAPERPHLLINGDYAISPWIPPDDLRHYGAVIVWCRGDCTHEGIDEVPSWYWPEFKDDAEMQNVLTIPQQTGARVPPAKIGWAFLPPHEDSR